MKFDLEAERRRLFDLSIYERLHRADAPIAGVDEAGRGPLAGPVVAAAVILDPGEEILFINDSKKLSEKKRESLYEEIMTRAVSTGVGIVEAEDIDKINILQATYEAMRRAVASLSPQPGILLNDAVVIPGLSLKQISIIKGDAKSISIGAASIIAKVTRDRIMRQWAEKYPHYHFEKNKGYGTAEHIEAIKEFGPCPLHRRSFLSNLI